MVADHLPANARPLVSLRGGARGAGFVLPHSRPAPAASRSALDGRLGPLGEKVFRGGFDAEGEIRLRHLVQPQLLSAAAQSPERRETPRVVCQRILVTRARE